MRTLMLYAFFTSALAFGANIHVQAHRGACAEFLENTLPAFKRGIEVGSHSIELDLHVTRDGHLVVHHDFSLNHKYTRDLNDKPIPKDIPIRTLTLAELRGYDVVDERRLKVPNTLTRDERRIPTLEEVFDLARRMPGTFVVDMEMKSDPQQPSLSPSPADFAAKVVSLIRAHWHVGRSVVRSFDHRTLRETRRLEPALVLAALTYGKNHDYLKILDEERPEILAPYFDHITLAQVKAVQARGVKVMPYTANTKAEWNRLLGLGVDGITTDDPAALFAHLGTK